VLLIGIAGWWFYHRPVTAPVQETALHNPSANIRQYRLADGTTVWLKPGARVSYTTGFGDQHRHLTMTGEVFFNVATQASLPFTVTAGGLTARVLGTSFSITSLTAQRTEVTVISGKVAVQETVAGKEETVLQPAQRITYASGQLKRDSLSVAMPSIWEGCRLNFRNTPLHEIVQALNQRFGVAITVSDSSLAHYSLQADFTGMHLAAILDILEKSLDAHYTIIGDSIQLEKNQPKFP
jgi:ferric-dicitrate binding protein FerR (iron transport regulator)